MTKSGVDLSEFTRLGFRNQRRPCAVHAALKGLAPKDRDLLRAAFAASRDEVSSRQIRDWLRLRSVELSPSVLTAHRDHKCRCAFDE